MTLDQHMYGSTDWYLPSPSSTPTPKSLAFADPSLQTPKTAAFPHTTTHFGDDARPTPYIHGQHTPARTPSFTLSTPSDRPEPACSLKPRTPEDPDFHVNHFVPPNLPLPPVEVARRLSSTPDPSLVRRAGAATMDFSHMQTPPPTRDANAARRLHQQQQQQQQSGGNDFATPATVIHRTPSQMSTAEALFNQTPFAFANGPFSPSMMPFSNTAPMSAPPMPQSRLFWDQPNDALHMDIDVGLRIDDFAPTPHKVEQNFDWQSFSTPARPQLNAQMFQSLHDLSSPGPAASFASNMGGPAFTQSNSFASTSASVDPNMLFSFSGPDMTASFGQMPQPILQDALSRQPYETQARDAQQAKENAKKARSLHSRSNTNSSSGSAENVRPGLQRSNTDSGFRKSKAPPLEFRTLIPAAGATIPRRPSPLKRQSAGLTAIPEIRRPRTRLIIDETGRARTETVPVEDHRETPKAAERASQKHVRRQYPGLWDEDDTESEDDEPPLVMSRNSSFNIPQPQRRTSKHARSDSGALALERCNSFKMPRAASRTSSAVFDKASFDSVRPTKKVVDNPHRRFSMMDLPFSFHGVEATWDQQMPDSPGDALGALKKVVAGRQQKAERASRNTLQAHNQRWAQASAHMLNTNTHYDAFSNPDDLSTPSTDCSTLSTKNIRCICNAIDDTQPMIQCEKCSQWLHLSCCGLGSYSLAPSFFLCVFCTGHASRGVGVGARAAGRAPSLVSLESPCSTHGASLYRR